MRNGKWLLTGLGLLCLGAAGCAGKVNVDGTVVNGGQPYTLKADEYLTVNLTSEAGDMNFNGKVTKEGTFTIETIDGKGVPPGKYKVTLTRYTTPQLGQKGGPPVPKMLSGGEVWDVTSSARTFSIDIGKYK